MLFVNGAAKIHLNKINNLVVKIIRIIPIFTKKIILHKAKN
jgi:hypothetical protein